jgi:hypothetical protein
VETDNTVAAKAIRVTGFLFVCLLLRWKKSEHLKIFQVQKPLTKRPEKKTMSLQDFTELDFWPQWRDNYD